MKLADEKNYVGVSFANNYDAEISPKDLTGDGEDPMLFTNFLKDQLLPLLTLTAVAR